MPQLVVLGASIKCVFGSAPTALVVTPQNKVFGETKPGANIMDHKPVMNIPTFGMCSSPNNPAVIAATAAALGVFTPAPCVPATASPWAPGSPPVLIGNMPALGSTSKVMCAWAGMISVTVPGQMKVIVK